MKSRCVSAVCGLLLFASQGCQTEKFDPKESLLKEDLYSIRVSIDQFNHDNNRAPETLEELVFHGYLKRIPTDPLTGSPLTWRVVCKDGTELPQDTPTNPQQDIKKHGGIINVHSASSQTAKDGSRYSDW